MTYDYMEYGIWKKYSVTDIQQGEGKKYRKIYEEEFCQTRTVLSEDPLTIVSPDIATEST